MPRTESQEESIDGLVPYLAARPGHRQRFLVLPLIAVLHLLLVFFLIAGLRFANIAPRAASPVQITLQQQHPRRPEPPPAIRLVKPEKMDSAPPEINIALAPQTTTPQGATVATAGGGANGNGRDDGAGSQGVRVTSAASPVPVPDPNCETLDAYTARVRSAIARFFRPSAKVRDAHALGVVTMHFFSDAHGRITDSSVTASSIERYYPRRKENGNFWNLIVAFTRTGANSWTWAARMHPNQGAEVTVGDGTVGVGEDGLLQAPGRTDGRMVLAMPKDIPFPDSVPFGDAADLLLLEQSVQQALDRAQPLPAISACLKLDLFNATMPFRFHLDYSN